MIVGLCFGYVQELPMELASDSSSKSIEVRLQELRSKFACKSFETMLPAMEETGCVNVWQTLHAMTFAR